MRVLALALFLQNQFVCELQGAQCFSGLFVDVNDIEVFPLIAGYLFEGSLYELANEAIFQINLALLGELQYKPLLVLHPLVRRLEFSSEPCKGPEGYSLAFVHLPLDFNLNLLNRELSEVNLEFLEVDYNVLLQHIDQRGHELPIVLYGLHLIVLR